MATSDEYIFKVKCSVDDEIDGIKSLFANAQATADKNAIKVRVTGDEKELAKELEKLKKLNPSVLTKIILDVDDGNLKETSDFLSKVIGRQLRQSSDISKAFKDQITSGIDENQIRELLSSTLKSAFGDSTKVTSGNISALYGKLKEEANELNATMLRGMDTDKAFSRITELAKKLEILQAAFKNQDAAGLTKTLKPTNLDFDTEELKSTIGSFYKKIGDYIGSDTQKLNDDIVVAYTKVKDTLLQNVVQIFSNGGKPILEALSIAGAQDQIARNTAEIEEIQNATIKKVQEARKNIENAAKAGYSERKSDANNLVRNFEIIKQSGLPDFDFSTLTKEQQKNINLMLRNAEGADKIAESVTAAYEKIRIQRENLLKMNEGLSRYVTTQNGEIGTQVASQLSTLKSANISGNSAGVEIEPVISDPAAFVAKIEAQLANQIVKIAVEPAINSVAEFQELLRQQLPNEFVDVKFNLENGSTLSLDGILAQFDTLKEKIDSVKTELSNLETLSGNSAASIKSIFEHLTIQQPTNSTQFSEILRSIKQLQDNVDKDIDMDKVDRLVQALSKIGELAISPNIDLSKFSLGGINRYLDKTDNIKTLGKTLDVLADGLYSLNISLTDAKFSELKDFTISDEVLKNLPKFAKGLEGLGKKLQTFSSSATGVLSSINQILSQSKSLEYLYNLANSPNSSKQSNIVRNGLLNAFDKSAINTIQHPAGSTDEVAALAKEYQWLTSQAKAYFTLASKYAKGTISSEDSLKLTQLERAMTGAIQRMAQFQETDQSLVTAQTDLQNALNKCGTAVESGLVNNLTKALTQIDTAENKALGFSNSIQEVKDKVVEIQMVFSTGGLIPTSEIEKAEGTLKKALSDVKQLKQDISEAKKAQENEIKNSYKNIFGNYGNTALGKAGKGVVTDEVEIQKLVNEYNYLNKALSEYIQLMGKEAANPDKSADRTAKIAALTNAYTDFIARADAGVDTESRLAKASGDLSNALTNAVKTLSSDLHKKLQSYIDKLGKAEDGTTKYSETIRKLQEVQQKLTAFQNTKATNVSQIKAIFDEYQVGADVYSEALAKIKTAQKEVLESQKAQLSLNIEKWLQDNTKAAAKYETELRQLQKDIQKVSTAEELDEIRTKVLKFEESAEKAKLTGSAFADTLKQKFKELSTYLMSFASFYQVVNILKQGISIAHEYDDAFTEMRKVTDASTSSLKEFQKESFQLANQVGTTAEQLQQSTADWLRLGESFDEAKKSAQVSNVLLNVSEFENIDSATESLVAMSQAYQDLDKMDIVDKLNNVG